MFSDIDKSDSKDVNSFHKLCDDPPQCTSRVERNRLIEIEMGLTKFLNIQDDNDQKHASSFISSNDSLHGAEIHYICEEEHKPLDKFLTKSATFPAVEVKPHSDIGGCLIAEQIAEIADVESVKPCYSCSKSFPVSPSKLVSAMKGSREKNGLPLMKLNVTWAPDVYDPIPTAVSHALTSKSHRQHHNHHHHHHRSKKHSNSKQKSSSKGSRGSSSSSSSGKDKKKQSHRTTYGGAGSSSSRCLKLLEEEERTAGGDDFYETSGAVDFDVGSSPDPYCGSSFLKKTVSESRFSVAEAT